MRREAWTSLTIDVWIIAKVQSSAVLSGVGGNDRIIVFGRSIPFSNRFAEQGSEVFHDGWRAQRGHEDAG